MAGLTRVEPLLLAHVTLPDSPEEPGQLCAIHGFAVFHERGVVLVDTGVGPDHALIEKRYRPRRVPLGAVLASRGAELGDVVAVVNSHLHFDHCGGNRLFPGIPIHVQRAEYEATRTPHYTVREWVDFPGACYELHDGAAEILPGISLVPSPGHTPGHQSVLVEDGLIVAQAAYTAREFEEAKAGVFEGLAGQWNADRYVTSLYELHSSCPSAAYFSHDERVWTPPDDVGHAPKSARKRRD